MNLWDREANCWSEATEPRMDEAPCPLGYQESPPQDTKCWGEDFQGRRHPGHWHSVYGTAEYLLQWDAAGALVRDDRPWQMLA